MLSFQRENKPVAKQPPVANKVLSRSRTYNRRSFQSCKPWTPWWQCPKPPQGWSRLQTTHGACPKSTRTVSASSPTWQTVWKVHTRNAKNSSTIHSFGPMAAYKSIYPFGGTPIPCLWSAFPQTTPKALQVDLFSVGQLEPKTIWSDVAHAVFQVRFACSNFCFVSLCI